MLSISFLFLSKMVSITDCGEKQTDVEIEILLKSLKSGKKLPLSINYFYADNYPEQLIAENYLDGLLEGYTLEFVAFNSVEKLKGIPYLKMNERLMHIFLTMSDVIKRRGLNLKFEYDYEGGLLLHSYKPDDNDDIDIGLRINGSKVECIDLRWV